MKRRHILATVFIYQMHWVRASKGACKFMIAASLDNEPGCRFADVDKLVDMVFDQSNSAPVDEAAEERVARRSEKKTSGFPKLVHRLREAIWKIGEAGSARRKSDRHDTVGLVFYRDGDRLYFVQGAEFQFNQAKRKPWQRHTVI